MEGTFQYDIYLFLVIYDIIYTVKRSINDEYFDHVLPVEIETPQGCAHLHICICIEVFFIYLNIFIYTNFLTYIILLSINT